MKQVASSGVLLCLAACLASCGPKDPDSDNGSPSAAVSTPSAGGLDAVRAAIVARNFGQAVELAQAEVDRNISDPDAYFELARAQALASNEGLALDALRKSIELGVSNAAQRLEDPAFEQMRNSERFAAIADIAYTKAEPSKGTTAKRAYSSDVSISNKPGGGTHIQAGDVVLDTDF